MYNSFPVFKQRLAVWLLSVCALGMVSPSAAQSYAQRDPELLAKERLFPEVGVGAAALRSRGVGVERRYYVLLSGQRGAGVLVFDAEGKRIAQIAGPALPAPTPAPAAPDKKDGKKDPVGVVELSKQPPKDVALVFGHDFDVDAFGRIFIADRGADAVKIFAPDGSLAGVVSLPAPTSVVALPSGELAVTSMKTAKLVTVFAYRSDAPGTPASWKIVREFGDPTEVTDPAKGAELNRFLNMGRLVSDPAEHIYYSFPYLPEPTVRKYDRFGYALFQLELISLEFQPAAQSARRTIERLSQTRFNLSSNTLPVLKPTITAVGVDPETQELWVAMGTLLLHFDREGQRKGSYRTYTGAGVRVEPSAILVEPDRLVIACDALGVFAFARPDKPRK